MLSDPRDMARLKEAFRIGVRAMTAAKQAGVVLDVFPSGYSPRIRELTRPSTRNARDHRGGRAADGSQRRYPPEDHDLCGRHLTSREGLPPMTSAGGASAQARQRDVASERVVPDGRSVGPHGGDRFRVRVIGVEGLRVCDASLMPTKRSCANLNIPVLMIAEKTAATIRAEG